MPTRSSDTEGVDDTSIRWIEDVVRVSAPECSPLIFICILQYPSMPFVVVNDEKAVKGQTASSLLVVSYPFHPKDPFQTPSLPCETHLGQHFVLAVSYSRSVSRWSTQAKCITISSVGAAIWERAFDTSDESLSMAAAYKRTQRAL